MSEKTGNVAGMLFVDDDNDIMLITRTGVIIRLHAADINTIGRATRGVTLMKIREGNLIVGCAKTAREDDEETSLPSEEVSDEADEETDIAAEDADIANLGESEQ